MPELTHLYHLQTFSAKSLIVLAKYNGSHLEINFSNTADGNDLHLKQKPYLHLVAAAGVGTGSNGIHFPTFQSCPEGRIHTHLLLTCKLANEEQVLDMYLSSGNKQA